MARTFLINLLIGLVLLFVLHLSWVQQNRAVAGARDAVISWQIAQLSGFDIDSRLAWINIDDASRAAWHSAAATPRDKLLELIDFARRGHPKVILVDISLSNPVPNARRSDAALAKYLRTYRQRCAASCAPITLAREFQNSTRYPALEAHASFLDPLLGSSATDPWRGDSGVLWGSVTWDPGLRLWRLWENSCSPSGQTTTTPSVVLLAAAITAGIPLSRVQNALAPHAVSCNPNAPRTMAVTDLRVGKSNLRLTEAGSERWLFYRIPWSPRSGYEPIPVFSAGSITEHANTLPDLLRGKVVVIGASTQTMDADIHRTPIGLMPGTLVIINAINTILTGKEIHEPDWAWTIVIEIALIVAVSLLFVLLPAMRALLLSVGIIVAGTLTLGFVALNSGVWFDTVLPLGGVLLHEVMGRFSHRH